MGMDDLRFLFVGLLVVAAVTYIMHGDHYRNRRLQLLQFRVEALEHIITGDHDV